MEDFKTLAATATKDLNKLLNTKSVKEYDSVLAAAKPNFDAVDAKFDEIAYSSSSMRKEITPVQTEYAKLWMKVRNHKSTLAMDPQPPQGGRKRKMTRRYCRKTKCRKMGFTQKASCRPWKNCY